MQHGIAFFYHINEQTVFIRISFRSLDFTGTRAVADRCFVAVGQVGKDVADLRVDCRHGFSLQQCRHASGIVIANPSDENGVQAVKMPAKVPEASLATEASVDQKIEAVDTEKSRVALSSGEDVESGMTEPDVAHHVRGGQLLLDRLRYQKWIEIVQKIQNSIVFSEEGVYFKNGYVACTMWERE